MKTYKLTYKTRDGHTDFDLFDDFNDSTELRNFWETRYPTTTIIRISIVDGSRF